MKASGIVAAALLSIGLTACGGSTGTGANEVVVTQADDGATVTAHPTEILTVRLESNASTGYAWKITGEPDPGILEPISNEYEAPDGDAVGAPGTEIWRFHVLHNGTTSLEMGYLPPGGGAAGETFTLSVDVPKGS